MTAWKEAGSDEEGAQTKPNLEDMSTRDTERWLVVCATSFHAEAIADLLVDQNRKLVVDVAVTGAQRGLTAVEDLRGRLAGTPEVQIGQEVAINSHGWAQRSLRNPVGRLNSPDGTRYKAFVTPYPYLWSALVNACLAADTTWIGIDDGLATPYFIGVEGPGFSDVNSSRANQAQGLVQVLTPKPGVPVAAAPVKNFLSFARILTNRISRHVIRSVFPIREIVLFTLFPLKSGPQTAVLRRRDDSMTGTPLGDWILIIGSPFERTLGEAGGSLYRQDLVRCARKTFPHSRLVYLGHPSENTPPLGANPALLDDSIEFVAAVHDWRTVIRNQKSFPLATFSSGSTLAYLLAITSGNEVLTFLVSSAAYGERRWMARAVDGQNALFVRTLRAAAGRCESDGP